MWDYFLFVMIGVGAGVFTGLVPGIHVNLVTVLVLVWGVSWDFGVEYLATFIVALAVTHSFLDSIPSIYVGAPDEALALGVLPGHRLLHRGEGHNAIVYTLIGSLGCLVLGVVLFPIFVVAMEVVFAYVRGFVGWLLVGVVGFMIWRDRSRLRALILFLLSGSLGIVVLNLPMKQALFGMLSGLFGVSILLVSLMQTSGIPAQVDKELGVSKKVAVKSVGAAGAVGFVAAFLPGFGSSQAAILASQFVGEIGDEGFLILVGGINTANMVISIATVYALDKARNGAIVGVRDLVGAVGANHVVLFLGAALVAGGLAVVLALYISRMFRKWIVLVPYGWVVWGIIGFILVLSIVFDGWLGGLVLLVSCAIGVLASSWGVGKNHLMGCLMLPVILFFV